MPIDVSSRLKDLLFDSVRAAVLTSATLAVDGGFTYMKDRLGHRSRARSCCSPRPSDYEEQAVLYVPRAHARPDATRAFVDRAADEIVRLLELSRGRAFVLFTSYANMNAVAERVAGRVDFPLLMQGEAPKQQLLDTFRATPHAVLLATASFWQGVDVAGEQLSCVIVDKLPFASPGDPVVSARIERLRNRGANAFGEYQVPVAVLMLKQGLGRLIRTAKRPRHPRRARQPARCARPTAGASSTACRPPASSTTTTRSPASWPAAEARRGPVERRGRSTQWIVVIFPSYPLSGGLVYSAVRAYGRTPDDNPGGST